MEGFISSIVVKRSFRNPKYVGSNPNRAMEIHALVELYRLGGRVCFTLSINLPALVVCQGDQ